MVQKRRSMMKAFTWRLGSSLVTFIMMLLITGQIGVSLIVVPVEFVIKLVLYYIHERVWLQSKFGIVKNNSNRRKP